MSRPDPIILKRVLPETDYAELKSLFKDVKSYEYQPGFSRYLAGEGLVPELSDYAKKITPMARILFDSKTLLPTYALFSHYEGENASLYKHKDDNACTYTIDMCVYQKEPWDLYVEGVPYTLEENQALAYYGNDQMHWRESFPNPKENNVAMIFFHFAEPEHWWFTKGPSYLEVVRGKVTEEEWKKRQP